jgi:type II secretory pathway component PulC
VPLSETPKLSGIMGNPDGRLSAVVDGRTVYEGYVLDGKTVKRIERDRVILEVDGREMILQPY